LTSGLYLAGVDDRITGRERNPTGIRKRAAPIKPEIPVLIRHARQIDIGSFDQIVIITALLQDDALPAADRYAAGPLFAPVPPGKTLLASTPWLIPAYKAHQS